MGTNFNKTKSKRTIIIGLDGVPFGLLQDLSCNGTMPNTQRLIAQGLFKRMQSSIPEISSVAWSSIITGKNPAEHGIFGFTELAPQTYRLTFPNFNNLKAQPFWKKDRNLRSVIINVPSTFPASQLNGVHTSGFVALDLERATYPANLVAKLKELDYRVDVDSSKAHQSLELFLKDLEKTIDARISVYRYLWQTQDWQIFMLVFTGTDRLSHFLWDAYEDTDHKFHSTFLNHFRKIDQVLGEIHQNLSKDDLLIVLSDHGFERLEKNVNINYFLRKMNFLKFKSDSRKNLSNIDYSAKAFALDPARIYINLKNKYPRGSVSEDEAQGIVKELFDAFDSLEIEGKKVIKKIYRKDEIFKGPLIGQAPDIVLLANKGFNLRANPDAKELWSKDIFTGKHTQHDAFLLMNGAFGKEVVPDAPSVFDIVDIMDRAVR